MRFAATIILKTLSFIASATIALLLTPAAGAGAASIAVSCGAVGIELELCRTGAEAWARRTGHSVQLVSTPNDANERLALYQQLLAARSGDIDVLQIDIVWTGILANHLVDLAPYVAPEVRRRHFAPIVENNIVDGRLAEPAWAGAL